MSNFPSLQPALEIEIELGAPAQLGMVSNGAPVTCVPLTGGKMRGAGNSVLANLLDAECVGGLDISRADPSFERTRLEVNSVWRNKDGSTILLSYKALLQLTEMTKRIFSGDPEATSTDFGYIFASFKFETGQAELKYLEENMFVGSGRMVVESGKPLRVEYKISSMVK